MNSIFHALYGLHKKRMNHPQTQLSDEMSQEFIQEYELPPEQVYNLRTVLNQNTASLSPKELEILNLRFFQGWTYVRIGDRFGVSKERIRQLQKVALQKIKAKMEPPQETVAA